MEFKINKFSIFLILTIISAFNLKNEEDVNKLYQLNIYFIIQFKSKTFNVHLRKMWEENVPFDESSIKDSTEEDDFEHCKNSNFKYLIYHVTGEYYNFTQESNMNYGNAVS